MLTHQRPVNYAQWMRKVEADIRRLDTRIVNLGLKVDEMLARLDILDPP